MHLTNPVYGTGLFIQIMKSLAQIDPSPSILPPMGVLPGLQLHSASNPYHPQFREG